MVDYSKWNNIELSDDDAEDCHPNIEKNTWIRLKREQRERQRAEEEQQHAKEVAEREALRKKADELQTRIDGAGGDGADVAKLKAELDDARKKEAAIAKKHADEEERTKKVLKWNENNICREGFSRTIINKKDTTTGTPSAAKDPAPAAASTAPAVTSSAAPPKEAVPAAKVVLAEGKKGVSEEEMDAYVRDMEIKAHTFAACKDFDAYYEYLRAHPEILIKETNDYLLLHVSDFIKKGNYAMSKKYVVAACLIQYSLELGQQGPQMLFHRLRDANPKYRKEFETQTMDYWENVKVKILELQAQRAARKAQGLPEDPPADGEADDEGDDDEDGDEDDKGPAVAEVD